MNVNLYNTMDYEEKSDWTLGENEPKTNPIKANLHLTAENAEYAEKKDISVSDCSIEKYALYAISPCSLRTRRLMKNKAKTNPIKANLHLTAENAEYAEKKVAISVQICYFSKSEGSTVWPSLVDRQF